MQENAPISKSQIKRKYAELTRFAEDLVKAGNARLRSLGLPADLAKAIADAEKIKAWGGRKRQIKYIGKLLRSTDPELIKRIGENLAADGIEEKQREKRITALRDRLLNKGDSALGDVLGLYPRADRQALRQLCRKAIREAREGKDQGAAKTLLRALRAYDIEQA